jgi:hypothetical protein
MTRNIIVAANEERGCPNCQHHFPLDQDTTRQTMNRYEAQFAAALNHS